MGRLIPFIVGGAAGAIAALLLSPNNGEQNRELVAEKVDYYSTHGEQIFQQAADSVRGKVRSASEGAQPTTDEIKAKINEARDRIAEQITRAQSMVQDVEADVADVAEEIIGAAQPEDAAE